MEEFPNNNTGEQWDNMGSVVTYHDVQEAVVESGLDSEDENFDKVVESVMKLAEKKGRDGEDYTLEGLIEEVQETDSDDDDNDSDLQKDDAVDNPKEADKDA